MATKSSATARLYLLCADYPTAQVHMEFPEYDFYDATPWYERSHYTPPCSELFREVMMGLTDEADPDNYFYGMWGVCEPAY